MQIILSDSVVVIPYHHTVIAMRWRIQQFGKGGSIFLYETVCVILPHSLLHVYTQIAVCYYGKPCIDFISYNNLGTAAKNK